MRDTPGQPRLPATRRDRIRARLDGGATTVGPRSRFNFITGANVTLTLTDDAAEDEIELTIAATGGGGGLGDPGANGIVVRTALNTTVARTLAAPAAGLTITNPDGVAANPTFALANDLAALEGLTGTGYAKRTAVDTWALQAVPIPIADGGTNGTTALAAFNNLSPLTTRGDLLTRDATNNVRLGIGTPGQYVRSNGTDPVWAAIIESDVVGLVADLAAKQPLDTDLTEIAAIANVAGDVLYTNGGANWARLAVGLPNTFLQITAGLPQWNYLAVTDLPSGYLFASLDFTGSDLSSIATRDHNLLTNFDATDDHAQYVRRLGRTGANNNFGITTSAATPGAIVGGLGFSDQSLWLYANDQAFAPGNTGRINFKERVTFTDPWTLTANLQTALVTASGAISSTGGLVQIPVVLDQRVLTYTGAMSLSQLTTFNGNPRLTPSVPAAGSLTNDWLYYAAFASVPLFLTDVNATGTYSLLNLSVISGYDSKPTVGVTAGKTVTIPRVVGYGTNLVRFLDTQINAQTVSLYDHFAGASPAISAGGVVTEENFVSIPALTAGGLKRGVKSLLPAGTNNYFLYDTGGATSYLSGPIMPGRYTTRTRETIPNLQDSMLIFNTDNGELQVRFNGQWIPVAGLNRDRRLMEEIVVLLHELIAISYANGTPPVGATDEEQAWQQPAALH